MSAQKGEVVDKKTASPLMEAGDENKFVIFTLGRELYGAKLLEVREVVESLPTKDVPNTVRSFKGVCNLRGQIVGVVDLRTRFGVEGDPPQRPVLLVFETDSGAIAASVDGIASVSLIPPEDIDPKPNIVSAVPMKFIIGIGKMENRMVTLLDLKAVLSTEELVSVEVAKSLNKVV